MMALLRTLFTKTLNGSAAEISASAASTNGGQADLTLKAYTLFPGAPDIKPAWRDRDWMKGTTHGFANRCLPLQLANQAGWFILNSQRIELNWNGGQRPEDLQIAGSAGVKDGEPMPMLPVSHFGHGIATWIIPIVFQTPRGCNLFVRGPTNWCKDGICPLDGIVETDWSVSTISMNWKITRPQSQITFERDEPVCMIYPFWRGYIEQFAPSLLSLDENPTLLHQHLTWAEGRAIQIETLRSNPSYPSPAHYFRGQSPSTMRFEGHQKQVHLRPFTRKTNS